MRGGYQGPIECLPELMAVCEGKENVFASIVGSELQAAHISQVTLSISITIIIVTGKEEYLGKEILSLLQ